MNSIFQKLSDKLSKSLSKQEYKKSDVPSSTDKEKVYCRFYGRDNPVTSEYCLGCGMQMRMLPSNIMKVCQKCGLAVIDDSVYCFSCGTKFDDDI